MEEKKLPDSKGKKELLLEKLEEIEKAYLDLMKAFSSTLSILDLKKGYTIAWALKKLYSFSWDKVPGNDSEILLRFLKDNQHIGWAENAEIHKSDDKTISIFKDENSASIRIDEKKKKATLKIIDGRTHDLVVKKRHGTIYIYPKIKHGAWLDFQEDFYLTHALGSYGNPKKWYNKPIGSYSNLISSFMNLISNRFVKWKIKRKIDLLRQAFLLLIAQSRTKIDSRIIKKIEINCNDMDKLGAQLKKNSFYAIMQIVLPFLSVFLPLLGIAYTSSKDNLEKILGSITFIYYFMFAYLIFYIVLFLTLSFITSRRIFSETAVSEKERNFFILIQEYLEFL